MTETHAGGAEAPWDAIVGLSEAILAISAETDLVGVLAAIADQARAFTGARYSALGIPHAGSDEIEHFVVSGLDPDVIERIGEPPKGRGVLGVMLRADGPMRLDDISAHPASYGFPPNHPPMRSFLGVPFRRSGVVVGALYLTEKIGERSFSSSDEAFVEVLARHAALAVVNARLQESLRASERRYRLLTERAPEIVLATDSGGVLTYVNARMHEILGGDLPGYLGRSLQDLVAAEDRAIVELHLKQMAAGAPLVGFSVRAPDGGGSVHDLEISLVPDGREQGGYQGIIRDVTDRNALAREMADRSRELLTTRREGERLREFVALFIQAQEDERARIAGDLHDTTVQTLTAIGRRLHGLASVATATSGQGHPASQEGPGDGPDPALGPVPAGATTLADLAAELAELAEAALAEADEVRLLSRNLRPSTLDHLGLEAAIQGLCRPLRNDGVDVSLEVNGDAGRLGTAVRTALFRIAQEALTNVRRHSRASAVRVALDVGERGVDLIVRDDGVGFDPDAYATRRGRHAALASGDGDAEGNGDGAVRPAPAERGGLGLIGMRERAMMMGGSLSIDGRPGEGTLVRARLPL